MKRAMSPAQLDTLKLMAFGWKLKNDTTGTWIQDGLDGVKIDVADQTLNALKRRGFVREWTWGAGRPTVYALTEKGKEAIIKAATVKL